MESIFYSHYTDKKEKKIFQELQMGAVVIYEDGLPNV
jgi:hypothetical protein